LIEPHTKPARTTFTDELWDAIQPLLAKQLAHPFVRSLGDGTLPRENFEFYIRQDARYLDEFAKTFAFAATRTSDHAEMERFGELLINTVRVERSLHAQYGDQFGLTPAEMAATPMAPTNYAYTRHLLTIATMGTIAELLAAILPCAWIYAEVGRHFARMNPVSPTHPYRDWIATYAAPEFEEVGAWLRERLNERAPTLPVAERARCHDAFVTSARYEFLFWDAAHRLETWPD
jgi:thiaminase (transcriptional activator TenA)